MIRLYVVLLTYIKHNVHCCQRLSVKQKCEFSIFVITSDKSKLFISFHGIQLPFFKFFSHSISFSILLIVESRCHRFKMHLTIFCVLNINVINSDFLVYLLLLLSFRPFFLEAVESLRVEKTSLTHFYEFTYAEMNSLVTILYLIYRSIFKTVLNIFC